MKAWIGIDPGQTGAMAIIPADDLPLVEDWDGAQAMSDTLQNWLFEYKIQLAALEKGSAMPKQGVSSTFKFGQNLGTWQGILTALHVPYLMPRPAEWQRGLVRKSDGPDPKTRSLAVARRLFPDVDLHLKKHHGRADALLLAWWAKQQ